jgi:hypothetical protein
MKYFNVILISLSLIFAISWKLDLSDETYAGALSLIGHAYDNGTAEPVNLQSVTVRAGDLELSASTIEGNYFRVDGVPCDSEVQLTVTGAGGNYVVYEEDGFQTDDFGTQFQDVEIDLIRRSMLGSDLTIEIFDYFGEAMSEGTVVLGYAPFANVPDNYRAHTQTFSGTTTSVTFPANSLLLGYYEIYLRDAKDHNGVPLRPDYYVGDIDITNVSGDLGYVAEYVDQFGYPQFTDLDELFISAATNVENDGSGDCVSVTVASTGSITYTFPQPVLLNYFSSGTDVDNPEFATVGCGGTWAFNETYFNVQETEIFTTGSTTLTLLLTDASPTTDTSACSLRIEDWDFDVRLKAAAGTDYDSDDLFLTTAATWDTAGCQAELDEWQLVE